MTLRTRLGLRSNEPPADAELREARVRAARQNSRWEEIEDDLVERGYKGTLLVSAETDRVYRLHPGAVFQPGSADIIATMSPLQFFVDREGNPQCLERLPESWSNMVARQASRRTGAAA